MPLLPLYLFLYESNIEKTVLLVRHKVTIFFQNKFISLFAEIFETSVSFDSHIMLQSVEEPLKRKAKIELISKLIANQDHVVSG